MRPVRAWLALLRPPNFLTVPGDVLAGFFLAVGAGAALGPDLFIGVLAALFFYAAGLLLNDWADASVDRVERPERPLPAGLVRPRTVLLTGSLLLLAAVGLCLAQGRQVMLVGLVLAAAIGNYNLFTKSFPLIGPVNMGLCRALNFSLGAVIAVGFAPTELVWWGVATLFAYIAAVTHLARREMNGRYFALERWLPALVLVSAFFAYLPLSELIHWPSQVAVAFLFLLAAAAAARVAKALPNRLSPAPGAGLRAQIPTPALIGRLIAILLPLQAAFIAGSGDGVLPLVLALVLLVLWPVKRWLGRMFYSS